MQKLTKPMRIFGFALALASGVAPLHGCGFQLRGYPSAVVQLAQSTELVFGTKPDDIMVKNALKRQLDLLALGYTDSVNDTAVSHVPAASEVPRIQVDNIRLDTYQLRGILTEIRMVMSADVSYSVQQNGVWQNKTQTLQVQRSYQYDQASVATDNPQADQIRAWLADNLAQRIADQYVALLMPATS